MKILTDDCDVSQNTLEAYFGGNGDIYIVVTSIDESGICSEHPVRISTSGGKFPRKVKMAASELARAFEENKFPKYIGFSSVQNPKSCLRLLDVRGKTAIYERPKDTGDWTCGVQFLEEGLFVSDCFAGHLIGKEVFPCSEEQFKNDNGYNFKK